MNKDSLHGTPPERLGGATFRPRRAVRKNWVGGYVQDFKHRSLSEWQRVPRGILCPEDYPSLDIASGSGVHAEQRKASHKTPLWFVSCSSAGRFESGLPLAEINPTGDPINLEHAFCDNGSLVGESIYGQEAKRRNVAAILALMVRLASVPRRTRGKDWSPWRFESSPAHPMKSILIQSSTGVARTHSNVRHAGFSKKGSEA